ncbi:hypothetical protein DPX16_2346 [Anabarilius grahami]|uniref:Uncharacterized protein n=1 Tax=Anabarilius grahami TaxID=495550 RepID=A0A3N0YHS7_ANAGA|nr:hypothetical protein DPX16_2346 [Anabarilius grahami]
MTSQVMLGSPDARIFKRVRFPKASRPAALRLMNSPHTADMLKPARPLGGILAGYKHLQTNTGVNKSFKPGHILLSSVSYRTETLKITLTSSRSIMGCSRIIDLLLKELVVNRRI